MFFIKNQVLKYKYNKNRKKTLRNLYKIADYSDKDFAQDFQHIMRSYLHVKFDYPFENCATSQMKAEFLTITQGLLDDNKSEKFDELVGFFIRTDFIRYGKNCTFENDEKKEIVRKTEEIIKTLEAEARTDSLDDIVSEYLCTFFDFAYSSLFYIKKNWDFKKNNI